MQKKVGALLLTCVFLFSFDLASKNALHNNQMRAQDIFAKSLRGFPILTNHGKMFFKFTTSHLSFPPGDTQVNFQIYVLAPNGKRINGPKLNGQNLASFVRKQLILLFCMDLIRLFLKI